MLLLTNSYIFNLDEILYVEEFSEKQIRIRYKNGDDIVYSITFEEFYNAVYENHTR